MQGNDNMISLAMNFNIRLCIFRQKESVNIYELILENSLKFQQKNN